MATKIDPKAGLRKNRVYIVQNLENGDEVADLLFQSGYFTAEMQAAVVQEQEREKKNRKILDTLNYRGDKAVKGLHDAFRESSNEELAKLLAPYVDLIVSEENTFSPSNWPPSGEEQTKMEKDSVRRIKDVKNPLITKEYKNPQVYKMRNRIRGKVIMINNMKFEKRSLPLREGSEVDASNLEKLFKELQFEVVIKKNLTSQEMVEFLTKERDEVDWFQMECVVLIISSHGEQNGIFGTDGKVVLLKQMTELFESKQCPGLNDKPRLVFIQACRGETAETDQVQKGNQCTDDSKNSGNLSAEVNKCLDLKDKNVSDATPGTANNTGVQIKHSAADFLIANATPEGNPAFRNIFVGSWFLNAIVWTFKYHAAEQEINHLLVRVNELVSKGRTLKGNLTVSEVNNKLTKKLYFFPGVYDDPPKLIDNL